MFQFFQKRQTAMRWLFGLFMGMIGFAMVVTMVPGPVGSTGTRADAVADVGGQEVSADDVRNMLRRMEAGGRNIPRQLRALYAGQVVDQLIYERMLELEAQRLGIHVSDEERAEEIKRMLPQAFAGGSVANLQSYASEVEQRFQMSVPEFEELLRRSLLESKVRRLVTDGLSVSPAEIEEEFHRKNEKVKLEYVVLKPSDMETQVVVTEDELASYFERNKAKYQLPERRSLRYILIDTLRLRLTEKPSDAELRAYYDQHLDRYKVQNRVHALHILFHIAGKTDAEVEEIRKKASDVLAKLNKGAKFEDLAKQYSEDASTKDKGGDLGWILEKQTVPEFEKAAFSLAKGGTSDLVKTQFGFHIIRLVDRETARTLSLDEARASILPIVAAAKAEMKANEASDKLAAAVRQSNRRPIEELAKEFDVPVVDVPPVSISEPLGGLGNSPEAREFAFHARPGELSAPIRTDRGYAVVSVKEIQPSRPALLADVHAKVESDYRAQKSVELVRKRAEELAEKAKAGETLAVAAKALSLEAKTSESVSRGDSIPDVGSVGRLPSAFTLQPGSAAPAFFLGSNWVVYRVVERQEASPEDLAKQSKEIEQQLLQSKQQLAYEAFRASLKQRMKREGKLHINDAVLKQLTASL
jgi:peptidyl-prolyl cis-trans isomerase D